jgi:hypothetical protein
LSEEAARRIELSFEFEEAHGKVEQMLQEAKEALGAGLERALTIAGYRKLQSRQGVLWAEPDFRAGTIGATMDVANAAAIVHAMEPEIVAALVGAFEKVRKSGGGNSK